MIGTSESVTCLYCLLVVDHHFTWTPCSVDFSLVDRQRQRERLCQGVFDTIHQYRDEGCPFETHNSWTPRSWSVQSYPISPMAWFQYYRELEAFLHSQLLQEMFSSTFQRDSASPNLLQHLLMSFQFVLSWL